MTPCVADSSNLRYTLNDSVSVDGRKGYNGGLPPLFPPPLFTHLRTDTTVVFRESNVLTQLKTLLSTLQSSRFTRRRSHSQRCIVWCCIALYINAYIAVSVSVADSSNSVEKNVGSALEVIPPQIQLSADYPAQVVVVEKLPDGSSLDRTAEVFAHQAQFKHDALSIEVDGTIRLREDVAKNAQVQQFVVPFEFRGFRSSLNIQVTDWSKHSPTFPREISAILGKAGCNLGTCHGNLHGKGGFRLSLRGDDPELDYSAIVRGDSGRRIDSFAAELSLLLRKPTGGIAHQGGSRFAVGSPEYKWLSQWIEDGCRWTLQNDGPDNSGNDLKTDAVELSRLEILPKEILLSPDSRRQQLIVLATFADGSVRDVTRWSRYDASLATDVTISSAGLVVADKPLDVSISVSYLSGRAAARLTFLPNVTHEWSEPPATSKIDQLVESQLERMRVRPMALASENVFLRRIYLVVVGRLPTAAEAQEFLNDQRGDKRELLTEKLLNDSGYAALWALRWSDLLRNEQKVMSAKGAQAWHSWMVEQVGIDRPLSDFVAEMITTLGSTYEHPPASFHRTHREPETAAESIGQVFLGVRLQCARCHNHPFDKWRQDDYYGLAAYFSTIERKQLENDPKDKFDKHIISGDEVISVNQKAPSILHPGRATDVPPKPLTESYSLDVESGTKPTAQDNASALQSLAAWLTKGNRMFARNMANRVWFHLMGRGIVDPPDDFRESNPASNPDLLEFLTDELIRSNYSVRHVSRLILQSRTFARAAVDDIQSTNTDGEGLDAEAMFAGYPLRRMPAEVLYDALSDVTEVFSKSKDDSEQVTSKLRAIARAQVPTGSGFLATFGKPNRLLACECERSNAVSLGQSLVLVNGEDMRQKLSSSKNRLDQLLNESQDVGLAIDQLYLSALTRLPETTERVAMIEYVAQNADHRAAIEDVLWALINSQEFALIR